MYTVVLILWLTSGGTDVVTIDEIQFQSERACMRAAPMMAQMKAPDLPPLDKAKARCIELGGET